MATVQTNGASAQQDNDPVKQIKQKVSEKATQTVEKAADTYENVKKMFTDASHNLQEHSEELYDAMAKYVRENPLKAIGVAALAGGLLAVMLKK